MQTFGQRSGKHFGGRRGFLACTPKRQFGATSNANLLEHPVHVLFHASYRQRELKGDLLVRLCLPHQIDELPLAQGEGRLAGETSHGLEW